MWVELHLRPHPGDRNAAPGVLRQVLPEPGQHLTEGATVCLTEHTREEVSRGGWVSVRSPEREGCPEHKNRGPCSGPGS